MEAAEPFELGRDYLIRLLKTEDALRLPRFKTGDPAFQPLGTFLKNDALIFRESCIAQTYVAIKIRPGEGENLIEETDPETPGYGVLGYITLTCSEIDLQDAYVLEDCPGAHRYDSMPAVKIARMAVDKRYRGKKIGDTLASLALSLAIDEVAPTVGCRFVVTDAKKLAVDFYKKAGFVLLDTPENLAKENPIMFIDLKKVGSCS